MQPKKIKKIMSGELKMQTLLTIDLWLNTNVNIHFISDYYDHFI